MMVMVMMIMTMVVMMVMVVLLWLCLYHLLKVDKAQTHIGLASLQLELKTWCVSHVLHLHHLNGAAIGVDSGAKRNRSLQCWR